MTFSEVDLKVIRGIKNAVADRGADWVYPDEWREGGYQAGSCFNLRPDGSAACIIGYIAVDQGLDTHAVSSADKDAQNWGVSSVLVMGMIEAQETQDHRKTWGAALEAFERVIGMTVDEALGLTA